MRFFSWLGGQPIPRARRISRRSTSNRDAGGRNRGKTAAPGLRAARFDSLEDRRLRFEPLEDRRLLTIFVVTGTGDADLTAGMLPGTIDPSGTYPLPSLRAAIEANNQNPGVNTIDFDISGTGPLVIQPGSQLPTIMNPVTIDGYSQPGATQNDMAAGDDANLQIVLNGSSATGANGLVISASGCVVQGLIINGFSGGIVVEGAGGNTIAGNFIGTNPAGTAANPNGNGIALESGANDNLIGSSCQLSFTDDSGNATGINGSPPPSAVNLTPLGQRNVVSGNGGGYSGGGVCVFSNNNVVAGNFLGTDATGNTGIGDTSAGVASNGVLIEGGSYNLIGGTEADSRNVISGNTSSDALTVYAADVRLWNANENTVAGNYIGTDASGTQAVAGSQAAVGIFFAYDANTNNTIQGNVISGHTLTGVVFAEGYENDNLVEDNLIGTDYTGTTAITNPQQVYGVGIIAEASGNRIVGNTIAYNITAGITSIFGPPGDAFPGAYATGNTFQQNSIYGNGVIGIDLGGTYDLGTTQYTSGGVTGVSGLNQDTAFGTPGPNDFQAYPTITSAEFDQQAQTTEVAGTLGDCAIGAVHARFLRQRNARPVRLRPRPVLPGRDHFCGHVGRHGLRSGPHKCYQRSRKRPVYHRDGHQRHDGHLGVLGRCASVCALAAARPGRNDHDRHLRSQFFAVWPAGDIDGHSGLGALRCRHADQNGRFLRYDPRH